MQFIPQKNYTQSGCFLNIWTGQPLKPSLLLSMVVPNALIERWLASIMWGSLQGWSSLLPETCPHSAWSLVILHATTVIQMHAEMPCVLKHMLIVQHANVVCKSSILSPTSNEIYVRKGFAPANYYSVMFLYVLSLHCYYIDSVLASQSYGENILYSAQLLPCPGSLPSCKNSSAKHLLFERAGCNVSGWNTNHQHPGLFI